MITNLWYEWAVEGLMGMVLYAAIGAWCARADLTFARRPGPPLIWIVGWPLILAVLLALSVPYLIVRLLAPMCRQIIGEPTAVDSSDDNPGFGRGEP